MSIQFQSSCSFIKESLVFMHRYYLDNEFHELKQELSKKSGYSENVAKILDTLQEIYDQVLKEIKLPENLSWLFQPLYHEENTVSLADCISLTFYRLTGPAKQGRSSVKEAFQKDNGKLFVECLTNDFLEVESKVTAEMNIDALLTVLEELDIKEELKWQVIKVYNNFDAYVDQIFDVIDQLEPIMIRVYKQYEKQFTSFYEYWTTVCKEKRFLTEISKIANLQLDDDVNLDVMPCWMGCNAITIHADTLDKDDHAVMYIGLFFTDSDFFFKKNDISKEDMCCCLKLISDPSKYEILNFIRDKARYGAELAEHLGLTTATISHHVNALANSGLIILEKESNRIYYRLNEEQLGFVLDQLHKDLLVTKKPS